MMDAPLYVESPGEMHHLYQVNGYLHFASRIDEALLDEVAEFVQATLGEGRIQDGWKQCEAVRRVALYEPVMRLLRDLYGRRPVPFQTLNFTYGTQQRAHSDTIHFNSLPHGFMCGVWVALEDVHEDAGPLFYCPGSHMLPEVTMQMIGERVNLSDPGSAHGKAYTAYEDYQEKLIGQRGLEKKPLLAKKGDLLIWSSNLLHGGLPRTDPARTRLSQVTHYFFQDCQYYTPMYSDLAQGRIHYRRVEDISYAKT